MMKTIFRFFSLAMLLTAFTAVGAYAQEPCADAAGQAELYKVYSDNYSGNLAARKKAVEAGKQFVEKYGSCENTATNTKYFTDNLPAMEEHIRKTEAAQQAEAMKGQLYGRFNKGFEAKNWDEVYAAGQEVLAKEPNNLDVMIVLGSIGFDEAVKKNNKFNDQTVRYARMAIDKMNSGVTSEKYGLYGYTFNNKENALGWMNMSIGYINFYGQNNKKDALQAFYRATQGPETKLNPVVYESIGRYYLDETSRLSKEIQAIAASVKDTDPDDVKLQKNAEAKAKVALLNGNAERAIDAYARAHKVAKTDAANKAYRDGLYDKIKTLYEIRFGKTTGIDTYISSAIAKPMPDPTSTVVPVTDPEPATTTTTTSTTRSTLDTSEGPGAPAVTAKTATAPVKTAAPVKKAAPAKVAPKKVVAKKG